MKTHRLPMVLFGSLVLAVGCDAEEQCVADCRTSSSTSASGEAESGSTVDTGDESTSGDSTGGDAQVCADVTAEAMAFIEANKACQSVLDCTLANSICFSGAEACGSVGVSADADLEQWAEYAEMMSGTCLCGSDPCGASEFCNELDQCEASWLSPDYCPSIAQDTMEFLAANRACEVDEDCTALVSGCDFDECSAVAVNVDTNADDWATLDGLLSSCALEDESYCNLVGECAPQIRCGDGGECEALSP